MKIVDRGTVFRGGEGTEHSSACFPSVCVLPGGRWLVTFRAAPRKLNAHSQRVLLTGSGDEGRTWSPPREPFAPPSIEGVPGAFRAGHCTALGGSRVAAVLCWVDVSDPSLPFFNEQTEGLLDTRIFLAFSEDSGETWSAPHRVETPSFPSPTPLTGPMLALPNGDWAVQFETNKSYRDPSVWHHASVLLFSRDQGRTWPDHVKVTEDPAARVFYWDQRPAVIGDRTILDVFWTFDRRKAVYRNIHARRSDDCGRTWSELWDTDVPGQPAPPVRLADGRLALAYMDREGSPRLKLRLSADEGRTWPADTELVLDDSSGAAQQGRKSTMQDAWTEMGKFSVGLPCTARLPDGDVLVVYYAGSHTDHTGLQWVRVRLGAPKG